MLSPSGAMHALDALKRTSTRLNSLSAKLFWGGALVWCPPFCGGMAYMFTMEARRNEKRYVDTYIKGILAISFITGAVMSAKYFINLYNCNTSYDRLVQGLTKIANSEPVASV